MAISLESIPNFTASEALAAAEDEFAITGAASILPSERDQNFLITTSSARKFVLKIANVNDTADVLEFQNQAMRHVALALPDCRVPSVLSSRAGRELAFIRNSRTSTTHCLRALAWVDGTVLALAASPAADLFESIGSSMGRIDRALGDFTHPAMRRSLQWDLRRAGLARQHIGLLPPQRRDRVERVFAKWDKIDWARLRQSVIHGDANDHNVIVEAGRMAGLLDFGDMVYSATICDLAIVLAYAMLNKSEPPSVAVRVIGAYHRCHSLTDAEQQVLFILIESRLAMSVCYSAHNRARNPHDPYQVVTETAAWDLLNKLELWTPHEALALIRAACVAPASINSEAAVPVPACGWPPRVPTR